MSMRKIREVLWLTHELGLSVREVREATGVGKTAVSEYVRRAKVVGITWPIPPEIGDAALEGCCLRQRASTKARRSGRRAANISFNSEPTCACRHRFEDRLRKSEIVNAWKVLRFVAW
jgi:hypothetical protein